MIAAVSRGPTLSIQECMHNAPTSPVRVATAFAFGSLLAAVAAAGFGVSQMTDAAEPAHEARMSAIPTPCDGFADCIYTAAWYAFWR